MPDAQWFDLGPVERFKERPLSHARAGGTALAVSWLHGTFAVVSGVCNHAGGPLGEGRLDGEYLVCPWHNYKFHRATGEGEPGFEEDRVPRFEHKVSGGSLWVNLTSASARHKTAHPHHLARPVNRKPGAVRVLGLSTTAMDAKNPRFSASDELLTHALESAASELKAKTKLIKLNDLSFRTCEGYYSKHMRACTWPCSITQMDPKDQLDRVYEALVHWADVVLVATPIRWGAASSLYHKMVERLNCVQNQIPTRNRVLIQNKVAGFIIMGGQDNIQAVAGGMLGFFGELGFRFPQFPYIAHSRGWSAEDMDRNNELVQRSAELHEGAAALASRAVALARGLLAEESAPASIHRGGRKAHREAARAE
ncbi:MAG: NAD(P)H-dependent oxidoreductase [Elusimicrobia bacterium]|nr:NAD(P)H-dependent oxidoreductase [Elusimicrobiota bacterium]